MESVFLSYTYKSHPAHEQSLDYLRRCVIKVIEAMGLRVIDGVDVGGRALDSALEQRIRNADALVALMTPQADADGTECNPEFVISEFQFARGSKKPTFRIIQDGLVAKGLGKNEEYTKSVAGREIDVVLKLMNTIAVWKREYGRVARVRIEPEDIARKYDEGDGHRCEFQRLRQDGTFDDYVPARVTLDPGACYAELPKLLDGDRVRIRMKLDKVLWKSKYAISPFVGGVNLEQVP